METPKIRFKDDNGQEFSKLKKSSLNKIALFNNGKAHEKEIVKEGKYIVINSKFISTNGKIKKYSNKQKMPIYKDELTMVMSDIPKGKAIAKFFYVNDNDKYTLNQRICSLKFENDCSKYFYYLLNRNNYFLKFDDGIKQTNLRKEDVMNCPIYLPCIDEQQKIANFLSKVDKKLENQKEIICSLENIKKGLAQKIFNQEIRFKDDNGNEFDEWQYKQLNSYIKHIGGIPLEKYCSELGDYKFISIGNYNKQGKYIDNGQRIVAKEKSISKILNKNDLVMILNDKTKSGDIIGSTILIDKDNSYIYNQRSEKIICKDNIIPLYLWFYLNSDKIRKKIVSMAQGSTQIYINFSSINDMYVDIPSIKEQEKIANFLSKIDEKIENEKRILEHLENVKKGLLQQMFV